jgi:hypothetical protein
MQRGIIDNFINFAASSREYTLRVAMLFSSLRDRKFVEQAIPDSLKACRRYAKWLARSNNSKFGTITMIRITAFGTPCTNHDLLLLVSVKTFRLHERHFIPHGKRYNEKKSLFLLT